MNVSFGLASILRLKTWKPRKILASTLRICLVVKRVSCYYSRILSGVIGREGKMERGLTFNSL